MSTPTPVGERHAADWEGMWQSGIAPGTRFDIKGVHPWLKKRIAEGQIPTGAALVPGCGRAYDLAALAAPDRHVTGLDIAPEAVANAKAYLAEAAGDKAAYYEVKQADFFTFAPAEGPVDFIFDYTFLCALPPALRGEWAATMAKLVKPAGELFCMEFPLGPYGETHPKDKPLDYTRGPPFLLSKQLYHDLLEPVGFKCVEEGDVPPEFSDPKRAGVEAYSRWRKE